MANDDPLAPFRHEQSPVPADQARQPLTERQALRLAINALNEVPNSRVRMEGYANTYTLIPDLEKAYKAGEERAKLAELAPRMYRTLLLCEDVLSELGRLDDGTPSISALIDIRAIQREAGNLSEEQVIKLMQGTPAQAPAEPGTEAKREATRELLDATKVAWQRNSNHEVMTFAECNQLHAAIVNATPEQSPARESSAPEPEPDIDLER